MRLTRMPDPGGPWLAIDCATDLAGLALVADDRLLEERHWSSRRRHTRELGPALEAMLERQGLGVTELGGIAVAIGPGSYTGLRIGLALAKGLAMGADLPIVGVPTLDILAVALSAPACPRSLPLWAVLQAGRGRVVAACYPAAEAATAGRPAAWPDPRALSVMQVADLARLATAPAWLAGELDASARRQLAAPGLLFLPPAASVRRASWLATLGRRWAAAGMADDPAALAPIYPVQP